MAQEQKSTDDTQTKPKKSLLPLIFALCNLGLGVAGLYLVYASTLGWQQPTVNEATEREALEVQEEKILTGPIIYRMEPFVVNLEGKPLRSIRLEVNLELLDEQGFEEVAHLGPEARDSIIHLLGKTNYDDIESIQGKLFLKDNILLALNDILDKGVVKDVFFSDFLIQ